METPVLRHLPSAAAAAAAGRGRLSASNLSTSACMPTKSALAARSASLGSLRMSGRGALSAGFRASGSILPTPSRVAVPVVMAKGGKKKEESVYKSTIKLPETDFNLRANSVKREPELHKFWEENDIYKKVYEANTNGTWTLHDGPPYANGDLHIGHALNKILKDFINRYQMLQGKKVSYVPGWDCHGLPIELKVLQSMEPEARKALTPIKLRKKAAVFAKKTVDSQREQFRRFGIWGEWEDPYMTLLPSYEAAQIGVFGKMVLNGHIYRGKKPVHWSPSSRTALAEAELEYPEGHTSKSVYVAMALKEGTDTLPDAVKDVLAETALAIWTTTPWTLPGNAAVAINDQMDYALVSGAGGPHFQYLVVAEGLVGALKEKLGAPLEVVATFKGAVLEGCTYTHPLSGIVNPVVVGGDYITTESGTGLVHTAPGHGQEDYQTGLKYNLPLLSPVDDAGDFTEEAGPEFQGLNVLGEGNTAVISALGGKGALLLEEAYAHKYPYDWRTKKPTIFRATEQWFASVEGFREEALEAIRGVSWVPAAGEKRITSMTEGRSDWCISRQRTWGVPIPVFYHKVTREPLMNEATIAHIQALVAAEGTDAWYMKEVVDLLPEEYKAQAGEYDKGTDTMDVWFDSGSSWAGVVQEREGLQYPADLYLEGSDQHRGWFQSSLLTGVAATGSAPYKQVLTHGFVLDEKGFKMSKSLGNVIDPRSVIEGGKNQKTDPGYGADVLRMWVASVDYTSDVLIGGNIIKQMADVYRKIRGTLRFLLGNLADFDASMAVPYEDLPVVDQYILKRLHSLMCECKESYGSYQFFQFFQAINKFCVVDLSNFYLDVAKDRLYLQADDSFSRRSCQTVLMYLVHCLLPALAPVVPHMAEDAWLALPANVRPAGAEEKESVFLAGWGETDAKWGALAAEEEAAWGHLLDLRGEVNKVLEAARTGKALGASLEAKVAVHVADEGMAARLKGMLEDPRGVDMLRYLFIVSDAVVAGDPSECEGMDYSAAVEIEGLGAACVGVSVAPGAKCSRCWNYSLLVGKSKAHPLLCERCEPVCVQSYGMEVAPPAPEPAVSA